MDFPVSFIRRKLQETTRVRCTWEVVVSSVPARWGQGAAGKLQEEGSRAFKFCVSLVCGPIWLKLIFEASWDHCLDRAKLIWSRTSGIGWHAGDRWTCVCRWDHQQPDGKCLFPMPCRCWAGFWACITYQHCSPVWKSPVAPLSLLLPDRTVVYFS